jgi:hypothetical protein
LFYGYAPGCVPTGGYPEYVLGAPGSGGVGGTPWSVSAKGADGYSGVLELWL